ncbi:unnamed protein product, partial [Tetraodon nigroviridis]
ASNYSLKVNRDLLDPEFESYRLSTDTIPIYKVELDADVEEFKLKEYTLEHMRAFGMYNYLHLDPWYEDSVLFVDCKGRVLSLTVILVGCELEEKEKFWLNLNEVIQSIPGSERVVIITDFNGHVSAESRDDEKVIGRRTQKDRWWLAKKWDNERAEEHIQEYREMWGKVKVEVAMAKQVVYYDLYARLDSKEEEIDLYRMERQRGKDGKDTQQVRVIKDRNGSILTGEVAVEFLTGLLNRILDIEKMLLK